MVTRARRKASPLPATKGPGPLKLLQRFIWGRAAPWSTIERAVLTAIVLRADNATGATAPGKYALTLSEISERVGAGLSSVKRALTALAKSGAISRFASRRADGLNAPTVYRLHPERLAALASATRGGRPTAASGVGPPWAGGRPTVGHDLLSESARESTLRKCPAPASGKRSSTKDLAASVGMNVDEYLGELQEQEGVGSHRSAWKRAKR